MATMTCPPMTESSFSVEIRNIATQALVQRLHLPGAHLICNSSNGRGPVYVASDKSVWRLDPVSFGKQVDQLIESKEFDEAYSLLDQISSLPSDEKVRCCVAL
jgi:hypothetical protein